MPGQKRYIAAAVKAGPKGKAPPFGGKGMPFGKADKTAKAPKAKGK